MQVTADLHPTMENKILVTIPSLYKDLLTSIPGAKYSARTLEWTLPREYIAVLALQTTFKHEVEIKPDLWEWCRQLYADKIGPSLQLRDMVASDGYPGLYPHQNAGLKFLTTAERAILADSVGAGKTYTSFSAIRRLADTGKNPFPLLVICPNSTKLSWQREINKMWPGLVVTVVKGTAAQRKKQLKTPSHVYIINLEAVRGHSRLQGYGKIKLTRCVECGGADPKIKIGRCEVHTKELNEIDFNSVILDEAHRIKAGSSKTARSIKAATGDASYRFALTGTPIANTPDDLWSILNWLNPEAFPSRTAFIDRYLDVSVNTFGAVEVLGIKHYMRDEFFAFLDPMLRRMPKEVVLPFLPPVVYERRDVEMSPKQAKAYEQMRDRMVAEIDGTMVATTSPLVKMTRMLQLAAAYADVEQEEYEDKETGETKIKDIVTLADPSGKIDAFMEDLDELSNESVVVFSPYKQLINLLAKRLDKEKIRYGRITGDEDEQERQIHMDSFQSGYTKLILVTTSAGGTGITLTKASIAVYLGRPWSNIDSEQSEGRIHRLGSEIHEKIVYRDYVTTGTVESAVFDALANKQIQLQDVLRDEDIINKAIKDGVISVPQEQEEDKTND